MKLEGSPYVIEFWYGHGTQPYFARLCSAVNGQCLATSEGYSTARKRSHTWLKIAKALGCEVTRPQERPTRTEP